jgi:DnaJ-domain-containing protein 1
MDLIDRFAELLKSLLADGGERRESPDVGNAFVDPDFSEAWKELDEYLRTGKSGESRETGKKRENTDRMRGPRDEDLRQDYANLEVPFGSDVEDIMKAYKILILRHHPDKHSQDPEKQRIATEKTKKINESFERIRSRLN